jgi:pimeloyl-ACP methyl ester carboxylesterase
MWATAPYVKRNTVPYVSIENANYYYILSGKTDNNEKTAIFVHGSGGDGSVWVNQFQSLCENYKIIIPDLPGHGRSGGNTLATAGKYAQWLNKFSSELNLSSFFLCGHSLGGAISLEYARAYAAKVKGLLLAGAGVTFRVLKEYILLLLRDFETAVKTSCISAYSPSVSKKIYYMGYEMLIKNGKKTLYSDMMTCEEFNSKAWISSIKIPSIVICGSDDKITPFELSKELSQGISESRLEVISGAGHMVMMEAPDKFNNVVKSFMDKH